MRQVAKYVSGPTVEDAKKAAAEFFGCAEDGFTVEVVKAGNAESPCILLAILKDDTNAPRRNMDAGFSLYFEDDGVFLEIYPSKGGGASLWREAVPEYIGRKKLSQLNSGVVISLIRDGSGRTKIAPPQPEKILDEDVAVSVSKDEMEGYIRFLPADEGGSPINAEQIRRRLAENGVSHGISDENILAAMVGGDRHSNFIVARGVPAVDGVDGSLEFHFRRELTFAPKEISNNRFDYRNLDLFESVEEGQLLVTRTPPTAGEPGYTVKGKELKARPGRQINMPRSRNTIVDEEKTTMHAKVSGKVDYIDNSIVVSDVYMIRGDCDMGVGNLDFDGSIVIQGNVIYGLTIKASGSITVGGGVEASELTAGGNIEIYTGVQGMDRARIIAGGHVKTQYIERATIIAGSNVFADVIVHSDVEAGQSVILSGKRSSVFGGSVCATREIVADTIGSVSHAQTDITVGLVPHKRTKMLELQAGIAKINEELDKLYKLSSYLEKDSGRVTDEDRVKLKLSAQESIENNLALLEEYNSEYNGLQEEAVNSTNGRVHVLKTAFTGTRITMGSATWRVNEDVKFATFKISEGEVKFFPCEYSRR